MKMQIAFVSCFLFAALGVSAQTGKTVETIRKYYTTVAEKVRLAETDEDQGQYGDLVMNELVINKRGHQWRAVGIFSETYKFFYGGGDSEAHMYPDQLVMVKVERRVSNRNYREEFVYDEAGRLIFYFQTAANDDQVPAERRIYFSGVKPIRVVEDGKIQDRLKAKDLKTSADAAAESARIKDLFARSIKL
jgi:hypothetical protein